MFNTAVITACTFLLFISDRLLQKLFSKGYSVCHISLVYKAVHLSYHVLIEKMMLGPIGMIFRIKKKASLLYKRIDL